MTLAAINIKVDDKTKRDAEAVFRALGLSMSAGINIYLTQVSQRRAIPFMLTLESSTAYDGFKDDGEVLDFTKAVSRRALNETW